MKIPEWVSETVAAFGRQMGLDQWILAANGAAALVFEDGTELHLEVTSERLYMMLLRACDGSLPSLQRLLQSVHPENQGAVTVRTAVLPRRRMAMWVSSCALQEVTVAQLETLFQAVWRASEEHPRV